MRLMTEAVAPSRCPSCGEALRVASGKVKVRVEACPQRHGLLLQSPTLGRLVSPQTSQRIRDLFHDDTQPKGACQSCGENALGRGVFNGVDSTGCTNCATIWFDMPSLERHVHGVRRRAFGEGSIAARADVLHTGGTTLLPAEVVVGLVRDYELELEDDDSKVD